MDWMCSANTTWKFEYINDAIDWIASLGPTSDVLGVMLPFSVGL